MPWAIAAAGGASAPAVARPAATSTHENKTTAARRIEVMVHGP